MKVRSPWAAALLPIITLGIYHLVWWYRMNKELKEYGEAKGYDLGQNPTNSVLALFPGGIIIIPALITYWNGHQARAWAPPALAGQRAGQRLDRRCSSTCFIAPAMLGLPAGLAEPRLGAGSSPAPGQDAPARAERPDAGEAPGQLS